MRLSLVGTIFLAICILFLAPYGYGGEPAPPSGPDRPSPSLSQKILFLNTYQIGLPIPDGIDSGFLTILKKRGISTKALFVEHLDLAREPSAKYREIAADLLREKLSTFSAGIVIAEGIPAIKFFKKNLKKTFPNAPLLTLIAPNVGTVVDTSDKVMDIPWHIDNAGTLALALRLFPKTNRVMVVTGSRDTILPYLEYAKKAFAPWKGKLQFEYTNTMTYGQMMHRAATLPKNSIIIYSPFFTDTTHRAFIPADVVVHICKTASAPVFSSQAFFLGSGIIGGSMLKTEKMGEKVAEIAADYLQGRLKLEKPITSFSTTPQKMVDWNALDRWKVKISSLPADCTIINRPLSLWDNYKKFTTLIIVTFMFLSVLSCILWLVNRRLKRLTIAAGKSRAYYRSIFTNSLLGITVTDKNFIFTDVNDAFCRMLGYAKEELVGKMTISDLSYPDDVTKSMDMINKLVRHEIDHYTIEKRYISKTGEGIPALVYVKGRFGTDGQYEGTTASNLDITERKRAEEEKAKMQVQLLQAQKMESVGQLAGGVAHDFNNMLGVILGHTDLAMDEIAQEHPIYHDLLEIKGAAERSAGIVRQLLAFARKQMVVPKVIDLNVTVESMMKMLRRLIGEDIDLFWKPAPDLWKVKIDPSQVDQLLANLCVNARDAITPNGSIIVETENKVVDDDFPDDTVCAASGEYVVLKVQDSGSGIPKELQPHIFEPFFTTKGVGKGTGLGLSTVYGIVKQNNGFIHIESEEKKGTAFMIFLPRHTSSTHEKGNKKSASPLVGGNETILLVEDEPAIMKMTSTILERLGYTVMPANRPSIAIRIAEDHRGHIDLLMTDIIMPEMNGKDLADKILTIHPETKSLFMSGYTADTIGEQVIQERGFFFIQKPFPKRDIAKKLREVIDHKNLFHSETQIKQPSCN